MDPMFSSRSIIRKNSFISSVSSVHPVSVLVPEHPGEGGGGGGPRVQAGQAEVGGQQLRLAQQRGTPRCQTSAAGKHGGINIVWEDNIPFVFLLIVVIMPIGTLMKRMLLKISGM